MYYNLIWQPNFFESWYFCWATWIPLPTSCFGIWKLNHSLSTWLIIVLMIKENKIIRLSSRQVWNSHRNFDFYASTTMCGCVHKKCVAIPTVIVLKAKFHPNFTRFSLCFKILLQSSQGHVLHAALRLLPKRSQKKSNICTMKNVKINPWVT